jgi:hypothetical protein
MKKRMITTIALAMLMLIAMVIPAYAAVPAGQQDNVINRVIYANEAVLIEAGIDGRNPDGRLIYNGNDFSDEAINTRIEALRTVFPQNMAFGPRQNVNCTHFTSTARVLVFGNLTTVNTRRHTDWNQLRVGDTVAVRNRAGNSHSVLVIDITNGIITIAEGNFGAQINWDRTFTMTELSASRGWNSGIAITSHFDINGDIMIRHDENGRVRHRDAVTGEITHFSGNNEHGVWTQWNLDGTVRSGGGTAPATTTTTPSTPAVTTPQTPATNNQTTTPTAPAQNNTQVAQACNTNTITFVETTRTGITFTYTNRNGNATTRNASTSGRESSIGAIATVPFTFRNDNGVLVITSGGETFRLTAGQSVTLTN